MMHDLDSYMKMLNDYKRLVRSPRSHTYISYINEKGKKITSYGSVVSLLKDLKKKQF